MVSILHAQSDTRQSFLTRKLPIWIVAILLSFLTLVPLTAQLQQGTTTVVVVGGLPPIYSTPTGTLTGNMNAVTMVTTSAEHAYYFGWTVSLISAGAGCVGSTVVTLQLSFTDPNAAPSTSLLSGTLTIAANGNGTPGYVSSGVEYLVAKSGTAVQFATIGYTSLGNGCSSNPGYQIFPTLSQAW